MANFIIVFLLALLSCQAIATDADFYMLAWFAPTDAQITQFESTMEVPDLPAMNGQHFVWSGLDARTETFLFQNMLDDDESNGTWSYAIWAGPIDNVEYSEAKETPVIQNDNISTIATLDLDSNQWNISWNLTPGPEGAENGEQPVLQSGTLDFAGDGVLADFLFTVETQAGGSWNFGPVTWTHIYMEVNSTDTSWCDKGDSAELPLSYTITPPQASVNGSRSGCYIERLVFEGPS